MSPRDVNGRSSMAITIAHILPSYTGSVITHHLTDSFLYQNVGCILSLSFLSISDRIWLSIRTLAVLECLFELHTIRARACVLRATVWRSGLTTFRHRPFCNTTFVALPALLVESFGRSHPLCAFEWMLRIG